MQKVQFELNATLNCKKNKKQIRGEKQKKKTKILQAHPTSSVPTHTFLSAPVPFEKPVSCTARSPGVVIDS